MNPDASHGLALQSKVRRRMLRIIGLALGLMVATSVTLYFLFRRSGWL